MITLNYQLNNKDKVNTSTCSLYGIDTQYSFVYTIETIGALT